MAYNDGAPSRCAAHVIDDLERERTALVRSAGRAVEMLELALHALRHDRPMVTDEFVERVIDDLRSALA